MIDNVVEQDSIQQYDRRPINIFTSRPNDCLTCRSCRLCCEVASVAAAERTTRRTSGAGGRRHFREVRSEGHRWGDHEVGEEDCLVASQMIRLLS